MDNRNMLVAVIGLVAIALACVGCMIICCGDGRPTDSHLAILAASAVGALAAVLTPQAPTRP